MKTEWSIEVVLNNGNTYVAYDLTWEMLCSCISFAEALGFKTISISSGLFD